MKAKCSRINMEYIVGQRVIAIKGGAFIKGKSGTVIITDMASKIHMIEFDENVGGHDGAGRGKKEHCWAVRESALCPEFIGLDY